MIPLFEPKFTIEDIKAVSEVLWSGWVNEHEETRLFEKVFAGYVGTKYAVATTSGTAALFLALKAAGVKEGSRVAVPAYTAMGTVRAIQLSGAWAVLVDVDEKGNIDVEQAKKANVSHVVAVHNNGYPCDIDALISHFGRNHVIEDACQSIGSHYNVDTQLGTLAELGCFSLATTKIVTAGQGGVVVTDNPDLYVFLQRLKNQGNFRGQDPPDTYHTIGYNFKWTEMNAALALSQMEKLPRRIRRMREIVSLYAENFGENPPPLGVLPWRIIKRTRDVNYVVAKMREAEIGVQTLPNPIHYHMKIGDFPNADKYALERIYLPSSFTLTDEQINYICDVYKEITS